MAKRKKRAAISRSARKKRVSAEASHYHCKTAHDD